MYDCQIGALRCMCPYTGWRQANASERPVTTSPLPHTTDTDEDHACMSEALRCVKELIVAVDSKVNDQEKETRLQEVYRWVAVPWQSF